MSDPDPVREIEMILRRGPRPERILDVRFAPRESEFIVNELDREVTRIGARRPGDDKP